MRAPLGANREQQQENGGPVAAQARGEQRVKQRESHVSRAGLQKIFVRFIEKTRAPLW